MVVMQKATYMRAGSLQCLCGLPKHGKSFKDACSKYKIVLVDFSLKLRTVSDCHVVFVVLFCSEYCKL